MSLKSLKNFENDLTVNVLIENVRKDLLEQAINTRNQKKDKLSNDLLVLDNDLKLNMTESNSHKIQEEIRKRKKEIMDLDSTMAILLENKSTIYYMPEIQDLLEKHMEKLKKEIDYFFSRVINEKTEKQLDYKIIFLILAKDKTEDVSLLKKVFNSSKGAQYILLHSVCDLIETSNDDEQIRVYNLLKKIRDVTPVDILSIYEKIRYKKEQLKPLKEEIRKDLVKLFETENESFKLPAELKEKNLIYINLTEEELYQATRVSTKMISDIMHGKMNKGRFNLILSMGKIDYQIKVEMDKVDYDILTQYVDGADLKTKVIRAFIFEMISESVKDYFFATIDGKEFNHDIYENLLKEYRSEFISSKMENKAKTQEKKKI